MDIQVLITTSTTDSTGPFNIVGNPGNITIATGQTKSELVAGKTFTGISELINEITITDTGVCNQAITRSVIGAGGTTPTPTPLEADFTLQPAYGISFGTITHASSLVPDFTYPVTTTVSEPMVSSYSSGTVFEVIATGARAGGQTVNINIQKNNVVVGYVDLNSDPVGQQTYYITISSTILAGDNLKISVGLGSGAS